MELFLVSFAGVVFGTIVMTKETRSVAAQSSLRLINIFGYMYGITYGILPACVLLSYALGGINLSHSSYKIDYSSVGISQIALWMFFGIIGYLVVQFSYRCRFSVDRSYRELDVKRQSTSIDYSRIDMQKVYDTLQATMIICFIISAISLYLWTRAYGGIWQLILIADEVRNGVAEIENPIAFFARPAKMILISFYMSLVLVKNRYNRIVNGFFLVLSFILSMLMLLALDGRLGFAMHILSTILLAQGLLKIGSFSKKQLRKVVFLGIIGLVFIMNMDSLTYYIRNGIWQSMSSTQSLYERVLSEFAYIFTGAQHSIGELTEGNCPYLFGHDILAGMFAWVPSSLRPDGIINIWNYNTKLCTLGGKAYGQLPCDFITTSVYALGIFGPLVYGLFWGWVIKKMDNWYLKSTDPAAEIFFCTFVMRVLKLSDYCLMYDFVLGMFSIALAAFIWWGCKHVKLRARAESW